MKLMGMTYIHLTTWEQIVNMSDPKDQNIVKLVNSETVKCKCKNCKKKFEHIAENYSVLWNVQVYTEPPNNVTLL